MLKLLQNRSYYSCPQISLIKISQENVCRENNAKRQLDKDGFEHLRITIKHQRPIQRIQKVLENRFEAIANDNDNNGTWKNEK